MDISNVSYGEFSDGLWPSHLDDKRLCMDDDHDACQGLDAQDERRNLWFEISFRGPS